MAEDSEGNQRVSTVDDLTNEQFARVIRQAQKAFGEDAALVAVDRLVRQPEEVK